MIRSLLASVVLLAIPQVLGSPALQIRQTPADSLAPVCPDGDGKHYTAPGGSVFSLSCAGSIDETHATVFTNLNAQSLFQCMEGCAMYSPCVAYTYVPGSYCRLYSALTSNVLVASTSNTGIMISTSPEAGYVGCPTYQDQSVVTQNGNSFLVGCNSAITAGAGGGLLGGGHVYYNFTSCMELCSTTQDCTAFYITDAATCLILR